MRNAGEVFGVDFIARVTVDGSAYVVYSDGAYACAIAATEWDDVKLPEPGEWNGYRYTVAEADWNEAEKFDAYTVWCSSTECEQETRVLARIATAADMECLFDGSRYIDAA